MKITERTQITNLMVQVTANKAMESIENGGLNKEINADMHEIALNILEGCKEYFETTKGIVEAVKKWHEGARCLITAMTDLESVIARYQQIESNQKRILQGVGI